MLQDLKDAGMEDQKVEDSDDEEMKEMTSAERKRHKAFLKFQEQAARELFGDGPHLHRQKPLPKKKRIEKAQRDERRRQRILNKSKHSDVY